MWVTAYQGWSLISKKWIRGPSVGIVVADVPYLYEMLDVVLDVIGEVVHGVSGRLAPTFLVLSRYDLILYRNHSI